MLVLERGDGGWGREPTKTMREVSGGQNYYFRLVEV